MANQFGASIKIDGEKEFKQALSEINAGLRVNSSELQKVTAEYADNGNSVEALTKKHEALDKSILSQQDKIEKLREALNASAKDYGESDQRTMAWQSSLNKAEAELYKMTGKLNENDEALQKASTGTTTLGSAVTSLASTVGIDIPPAFDGMIQKLDGVSASGAALVGVLAGVTTALVKTTVDTAKTADEIMELSSTSGMTTDQIQELSYASELLDVSVDTIDSTMTKMIRSMESGRDGAGEQAEAFNELGVKITDTHGSLNDANEVFLKTIDALGKVSNETERDALSMAIFGKSARDLNPLIEAGSGKLKELSEEAHKTGYVMSGETLESFGQLDDAMQRLDKQGDALKNSFAAAMLPMLTTLAEAFGKIPAPVLQATITIAGIVATIILTVKAIKEVTATKNEISGFFKLADGSLDQNKIKILAIIAALTALAVAIAVIIGKSGELQQTFGMIQNGIGSAGINSNDTSDAYSRVRHYAKGTTYHPGGRALVGENGPEIAEFPAGTKVYPNGVIPSGGDTYYITIDAKNVQEFNDIVRIAKDQRRRQVQGG